MECIFWIPIIISLMAFVISVLVFIFTWFTPFNPKFNPGNPLFACSPGEENEKFYLTPIIPVDITNAGAKGGTINDINIIVTVGDYKWILAPQSFCSEFGIVGIKEKTRESFHPIYIKGKESVYKNILFNPDIKKDQLLPPVIIKDKEVIPSGVYTFQFYISYGSNSELKLVKTMKFNITKKLVRYHIPFDEEVELARDKFRNNLIREMGK